jgi:hypothetical protein
MEPSDLAAFKEIKSIKAVVFSDTRRGWGATSPFCQVFVFSQICQEATANIIVWNSNASVI